MGWASIYAFLSSSIIRQYGKMIRRKRMDKIIRIIMIMMIMPNYQTRRLSKDELAQNLRYPYNHLAIRKNNEDEYDG